MSRRRPGPQPVAPELTVLRGNPGHRPVSAPSTPKPAAGGAIPRPPASLLAAGRAAWRRYWTGGRAWLGEADFEGVRRLCTLIDIATEVEAAVRAEGFLVKNARTKRSAVHAGFNTMLGIYKAIADLESAHGFPATERGRIKTSSGAGDDIDRWMTGGSS